MPELEGYYLLGATALPYYLSCYKVNGVRWCSVLAATKPSDGKPLAQLCAEWNYNNLLHVRAGYQPNDAAAFSFGGGVTLDVGESTVRINYVLSDFGGKYHVRLPICIRTRHRSNTIRFVSRRAPARSR